MRVLNSIPSLLEIRNANSGKEVKNLCVSSPDWRAIAYYEKKEVICPEQTISHLQQLISRYTHKVISSKTMFAQLMCLLKLRVGRYFVSKTRLIVWGRYILVFKWAANIVVKLLANQYYIYYKEDFILVSIENHRIYFVWFKVTFKVIASIYRKSVYPSLGISFLAALYLSHNNFHYIRR